MNSSNEFNRFDDENLNNEEIYKKDKYNIITDGGDINDYLNENIQSYTTTTDNKDKLSSSHKFEIEYISEDNQTNYQSSLVDINPCTISTSLIVPQTIRNHIKFSNSFQQLWSSRVYSPKLIHSKTSENTLSIILSLIILLSKLILTGFYFLYSSIKVLQYDKILFSFSYILGAIFGLYAYLFIDFFLILTCIISILVTTYEKWLFHSINLNELSNNNDNENENDHQYCRQIKIASYGLIIGIFSSFIA